MWIDTHCHLDAREFDDDRDAVLSAAERAGVRGIVVPAVSRGNFGAARDIAHRFAGGAFALGIHPMYTPHAAEADLAVLRDAAQAALGDARFVAIGEIGLDFFVEGLDAERQHFFYVEQLKIARELDLPVILHVRRSQDALLKQLRRFDVRGGIAHAFNGSFQQAEAFIERGFKLGFGGALTFERALQIRRLATQLPLESLVMETDAPDIPPAWRYKQRNEPGQLPRMAAILAGLREVAPEALAAATTQNAYAALPRLRAVLAGTNAC